MPAVVHAKASTYANRSGHGDEATLILPSDWNAGHTVDGRFPHGTAPQVLSSTAGSLSWTPSSTNVTMVMFELMPAGGGGGGVTGSTAASWASGAGGGAGGYAAHIVASPGTSGYAYSIGSAGTAGTSAGGTGGAGGNITLTTSSGTVTAHGGGGGTGQTLGTSVTVVAPGSQTVATGASIVNTKGEYGGVAHRASGTVGFSGCGGSSPYGQAGRALVISSSGISGTGYGAGGSGACSTGGTGGAGHQGGVGAPGAIFVWEYC